VEEVLGDWIDSVLDRPDFNFLLHAFFELGVDPEGQAQINGVVHVHYCVLAKLKLANEPF